MHRSPIVINITMRKPEMKQIFIAIFCLFLLGFSGSASSEIIVNEYVGETQLTRDDIIRIFLFYRKFWEKSGNKIVVVLPPPNSMLFKKLASEIFGFFFNIWKMIVV
jgi:hypothetical protein